MKVSHVLLAIIAILGYNVVLIHRDSELFRAYDTKCAEITEPNSRCYLSK